MSKKRLVLYGLVIGLAIGLVAGFYVYQEYLGEDPALNPDALANPIIDEKLRAIVTNKTGRKIGSAQKLVLNYTDLDNQKDASVTISDEYGQNIQLGDTLTKDKGEKILLVYQKDGKIITIPID